MAAGHGGTAGQGDRATQNHTQASSLCGDNSPRVLRESSMQWMVHHLRASTRNVLAGKRILVRRKRRGVFGGNRSISSGENVAHPWRQVSKEVDGGRKGDPRGHVAGRARDEEVLAHGRRFAAH